LYFGTKFALKSVNFKTQKINTMKLQFHTWFNPKNSFQMELFLLFKPKLQRFIWAGLFLLLTQAANAQVSGIVFRDFNANGVKDNTSTFNEVGLAGVTVTAYNTAGTAVGTATSASDGTYTITGVSGAVRVEFTGLPTAYYSSKSGGTSVQFVTAPVSGVNFAANVPDEYWDSSTNPRYVVPQYWNGSASANTAETGIVSTLYGNTGLNANYQNNNGAQGTGPVPRTDLLVSQIGTVWGEAYYKEQKHFYFTTFLKRHSGMADGPGYIYNVDYSSATPVLTGKFDLQGVVPSNGGAAIDLGTVTRTGSADYTLPSNKSTPSRDIDAFGKVATIAYGDCDMQPGTGYLWAVNLFQKALIRVDVSGNPTSVPANVEQYILSSLPGFPTSTTGVLRPWALDFHQGKGYLGIVDDASISGLQADLRAIVLEFDPNNIAAGFTQRLNFDPNPPRTASGGTFLIFKSWLNTYSEASVIVSSPDRVRAQPVLSDIEFDENDNMYLSFFDRFGHQMGYWNYLPISGSTTTARVLTYGEIDKACKVGSGWVLEGNSLCPYLNVGDYEFIQDIAGDAERESSEGAIALLKGKNQLLQVSIDPHPQGSTGDIYWTTQGVNTYNLSTGEIANWYSFYQSATLELYGKANGLGDIELLVDPAPLEIGNRVWNDTDSDGIQDAGEAGIDGITVELYEGTTLVGTATTANGGQWYFNDANVNQNGATQLKPNTAYTIRVVSSSFPSGQSLTDTNADGTTNGDVRDNDATLVSGNAEIAYTTGNYGQNDHTLDMGFRAAATCTLTVDSTVPTACSPATNTYNLAVTVSYADQPAGDITINVGGTNYTFTPDGTSPDTYTVTGLTSNGTTGIDVTATFVGDNACTDALADAYNAPASCSPPFVACGDIPVIWLVDEDQAAPSMHLWSFKNYNDATNTGTDYGRVTYIDPATGDTTAFATSSSHGDLESMAVNQSTGQAYFLTASKISGGPSGGQTLFTYNLNDAAANKGKIAFTVIGHIQRPNSWAAEVLALYNNHLYLADPITGDQNNDLNTDILMSVDLAALNPDVMQNTIPTILGQIQGLGETNKYVDGMEILPDGTLYTVDGTDDHLYRVSLATGAILEIMDNNIPGGIDPLADVETIVWDPVNSKLIGADNQLQQFVNLTLDGTNGNNTVTSPYIGTPGIYSLVDFEGSAMFVMCCDLTVNSAVPSGCDVNGQYTLSVDVTYTNISGNITINGQTFTPAGITGRETFVLTLLTADGAIDVDVTAQSVTEVTCSATLADAYNAPANCVCQACPTSINLVSASFGPGIAPQPENVTLNSGSNILPESNIAGFNISSTSIGNFYTFCTEISQPILPLQNTYTYENTSSSNGFSPTSLLRISQVFQAAGFNSYAGFGAGNNSNVQQFVALQLAVWNALYDTDYSVTSGSFQSLTDNNGAVALANTWLASAQSITNPIIDIYNLHNSTGQDLVIMNCLTAMASSCNSVSNTYDVNGHIVFANPPSTGTLSVTIDGASQVFNAPFVSPIAYTISGLAADGASHTVTATFSADPTCVSTDTYDAPASCACNLSATATGTNVLCNAGTGGTATATATGNLVPVTYLWSNGETTASITGLVAGTYTVTVTETPTCTAVASYTVTEPLVMDAVCSKTDATTIGGAEGTATVTATGGTAPYTYLWSNGETTQSISGLTAGTYTVTVTDLNGCTANCMVTVQEPGCNLSANATGTNVSCNAGTDGTAIATATGNLVPVTYLWSNGETTASISGLAAGSYTVTVTETPTCTAVASYTVTEPLVMDAVCSKTDATTIGGAEGTATVTATGGTAPYTYLWSNGETTQSISGLTAGTYTVTVTDLNGCTANCMVTVQEPGCNLSANATGTNVSCNAGTDGTAIATATGNLVPVTYLWSNGETTASITGLVAGTYTVTVTETPTCTAVASYTVTEPLVMDAVCSKTDATTIGGAEGTATVNATGGTAPYTYLWSNGETTQSISGLTAGTYTVTVTDLNGCTANCMVTVQEPGCNLSANATGTNVSCNAGTDGTAIATATGNLVPVTYLWSNGETTASITGLVAGTYTVTVTETPTCTAVASYTVTEPAILDAACSKTDATTIGGADGTASVTATGGTAPYTYLWSNGETTQSISGLTAGTYTVTVTDLNGCTANCMVTVQEPGCNLSANATGTNVSCNAGTDGTAIATATGNLVPVTYLWSNGETTASITGLVAGTYTVTVTETPTCTAVASYTVTEPAILDAACSKTNATTIGGNQGTASVTATGGTAPYTYLWSNGETTQSISGLTAGAYSVTVTDLNGCTANCMVTVQEPGCNLSATADGTNVLCNAGTDGTATATATGNLVPVTYLWSNGATTASITGLTAGTYTVTVTETPICTAVASYTVTEPTLLDAACSKTDATTIGGADGTASVIATGGTAPYTYLWSNGAATASITGLTAGTYTVTVTDLNGCTANCNVTVQEPGCNLSANATGTNVSCNAGTDGTAAATASGNLVPVTYLWSNGETTASITGLVAGTYTVTVTETPTCTAVASYTVTEPLAIDAACSKTNATTIGGNQGTASVTATGGTAPYTYLWSNGETTQSISGLTAGAYSVTVTDLNGCTANCMVTVQEPGCPPAKCLPIGIIKN
jgi:hypothetical protein